MAKDLKKLEEIVKKSLDQLRPYLHQDGGDMEFIEITDEMVVKIRLIGNCSECMMSTMTMKAGLEEAIKEVAPEIVRVEAVNGIQVAK